MRERMHPPFDLTSLEALSEVRHKKYIAKSNRCRLHFGFEQVSDTHLEALFKLAEEKELLSNMKKVQEGEVMNRIIGFPSENRQVTHTRCRDPKDAFNQQEIAKAKSFAKECDFQHVVVVGIGGSNLGTEAIFHALSHYKKDRELHFIANIDPRNTEEVLSSIDLFSTLFVFASKSGGTLEIQSVLQLVTSLYKGQKLDPREHFVMITIPKSPLDDPNIFKEIFYMEESVGGRFSVTSQIGVLPLVLVYGDKVIDDFLAGAYEADKVSLEKDPWKNPSLMDALLSYYNLNILDKDATLIAPYAQDLKRLTAHFQQLFMESNSKQIDIEGRFIKGKTQAVVFGEPLTCAQHSFYQGVHQGTFHLDMTSIGFIRSVSKVDVTWDGTTNHQKLNANLVAQSIALAQGQRSENTNQQFLGNRSTRTLMFEKLDAKTTGYLLSHYEAKTIFYGFLLNVNSFDQEGVQLGKKLAIKYIDKMKSQEKDHFIDIYLKW